VTEVQAPNVEVAQAATWRAFKGKLKDPEIPQFVDATTGASRGLAVPAPITASASAYFGAIFGVVKCEPGHEPYLFEEYAWGIGASAGSGGGFLYTAYDSWDAFWEMTAGYHAQGIAEGGGILQINFFNSSAVPIGQYNGVAGGIGVFECGGSGRWSKK
jgi:hypothetical protein